MKTNGLIATVASGAFYSLLMPLAAIVTLRTEQYGLFSAIYLLFAFGISLQYSLVSEAWARNPSEMQDRNIWKQYSSALALVSLFTSLCSVVFAAIYPQFLIEIVLVSFSIVFGVLRSGIRYSEVANIRFFRVFLSDSLGILVFLLVLLLNWESFDFEKLSLAWFLASVVTLIPFRFPDISLKAGFQWFISRKSEIKPLIADSLMLDFSAIVVPYLTMLKIGLADFGIYRGIASAAVPVRLIIDPLRPYLGKQTPDSLYKLKNSTIWTVVGLLLGILVFASLSLLVDVKALKLTTIHDLYVFRLEAAIYTTASFYSMVLYIVARTHLKANRLVRVRIYQTLLVSMFPLIGVFLDGLSGAVWGFVISNVISVTLWYRELYVSRGIN